MMIRQGDQFTIAVLTSRDHSSGQSLGGICVRILDSECEEGDTCPVAPSYYGGRQGSNTTPLTGRSDPFISSVTCAGSLSSCLEDGPVLILPFHMEDAAGQGLHRSLEQHCAPVQEEAWRSHRFVGRSSW